MKALILAAAMLLIAAAAAAADLAAAVRNLDHGLLLLSYPSREDVIGGPDHLSFRVGDGTHQYFRGVYDAREAALFWLAVFAGEKAVGEARTLIEDPSEDLDLRTHAVFALTQMDDGRAFPLLMQVAREHPHPELRRSAYIWLAEYDRPEVVALFEEILLED